MSAQLAMQQTALLDVLHLDAINLGALRADFVPAESVNGHFSLKNPAFTLRGLRAYRANAQELSARALQTAYPVLQQLLGADNFSHIAQDFWQAMPPRRGDLAQWGHELPAYLLLVPQLQALLQEHPYVNDVARVEWALHAAATASDAALDAASFQLLSDQNPAQLRLQLSPGCALLRSIYSVVAIVQLHDTRASELHAAAREAIAQSLPQAALVWRQGLRPMLACTDAASSALIEATLAGQSLAAAVDAAFAQNAEFDFGAWLSASVQSGLLLGAVQTN
ncbi:MAG: DUF2063 domain-containing protein [Burkholderiales bacterium]|nr:MAG: DUF2063 domain-containing protein [Burkholderiales bacterium]